MKLGSTSRQTEQSDPMWQVCQQLTTCVDPLESNDSRWSHTRRVTWAHRPYRYLLTELAQEKRSNILRRARITPLVFNLDRLSADQHDGLVNLSAYFIAKNGLVGALHSQVPRYEDLTEQDKKDIQGNVTFSFTHGFFVPTAEDEVEIETALHMGLLDGVTALQ